MAYVATAIKISHWPNKTRKTKNAPACDLLIVFALKKRVEVGKNGMRWDEPIIYKGLRDDVNLVWLW